MKGGALEEEGLSKRADDRRTVYDRERGARLRVFEECACVSRVGRWGLTEGFVRMYPMVDGTGGGGVLMIMHMP